MYLMTQWISPENFLMSVITVTKAVSMINLLFRGTICHTQIVFLNVPFLVSL